MSDCKCPVDKRSSHCPEHGDCYCYHGGSEGDCPTHDLPEAFISIAEYDLKEYNRRHICAAFETPGNLCIADQQHAGSHSFDGPQYVLERCGAIYTQDRRITCLLPGKHFKNHSSHWCAGWMWAEDRTVPQSLPQIKVTSEEFKLNSSVYFKNKRRRSFTIVDEDGKANLSIGSAEPEGEYYEHYDSNDSDDPENYLICKFCKRRTNADTAHLHQEEWVGDGCCWDEKLRATE